MYKRLAACGVVASLLYCLVLLHSTCVLAYNDIEDMEISRLICWLVDVARDVSNAARLVMARRMAP